MNDRNHIYDSLKTKMKNVGFLFEKEQGAHHQNRKEPEMKFIHPLLVEKLQLNGHTVGALKFYIKPLSDEPNSDIGLVNGTKTPLNNDPNFNKANTTDTFRGEPAWTNREEDAALDELLNMIGVYVGISSYFPEEIKEDPDLYEGMKTKITVNKYERNPIARAKCIEHHECICKVCDFDFYKSYGEIGKGYIHVHHLTPLHTIDEAYKVDYVKDLIPVCPNCHAMLHRKVDGREPSIDELRNLLNRI